MSMKLSYQEKFLQKIKKHKKSTNKHVIIGIIILFVFIVGFELFYKQRTACGNNQSLFLHGIGN